MILDNSSLYACVLAFLCVLGVGDCLKCYHCNATHIEKKGDPCKGIQTLKQCQGPAVCLTFEVKVDLDVNTTSFPAVEIVKTCFPSGGDACSKFIKEARDIPTPTISCKTCNHDGCNLAYHVSANFCISLLLWIAAKFL